MTSHAVEGTHRPPRSVGDRVFPALVTAAGAIILVTLAGVALFLTYEGLPSDYYLRLTGEGARLLRGEIPLTARPPTPTHESP